MRSRHGQFVVFSFLYMGAVRVSMAAVSAAFNSYVAPSVIVSNTTSGAALSGHLALSENSTGTTFTVWGSGTGTGSVYDARVLGNNTGSNYLHLESIKGSSAYNLMSQVSTTEALSLDERWTVKARFSVQAGSGSLYLGLYADNAMTSLGGYDYNQLIVGGTNAASVALGLSFNSAGNAVVVRTAVNNKLEFWTGNAWVTSGAGAYAATGLDVTGSTQYDFSVSTDGAQMQIRLVNAATSAILFDISSAVSEIGSNITSDSLVRFSCGDIANNSTDGWRMDISSLMLQGARGTISLVILRN